MRKEKSKASFQTAMQTTPLKGYWGLGLEHDMAGLQIFFWVEDRETFIQLLRQYANFVWQGSGEEPDENLIDTLNDLLDQFEKGHINPEELGSELENNFLTYIVFWCGLFDDLVSSDLESADAVRAAFWDRLHLENGDEDYEEGEDRSPIPNKLIGAFSKQITGEQL